MAQGFASVPFLFPPSLKRGRPPQHLQFVPLSPLLVAWVLALRKGGMRWEGGEEGTEDAMDEWLNEIWSCAVRR